MRTVRTPALDVVFAGNCMPDRLFHLSVALIAPGAVGHLSFTDILDTSLKVSWKEPQEKNGVLTGDYDR